MSSGLLALLAVVKHLPYNLQRLPEHDFSLDSSQFPTICASCSVTLVPVLSRLQFVIRTELVKQVQPAAGDRKLFDETMKLCLYCWCCINQLPGRAGPLEYRDERVIGGRDGAVGNDGGVDVGFVQCLSSLVFTSLE